MAADLWGVLFVLTLIAERESGGRRTATLPTLTNTFA